MATLYEAEQSFLDDGPYVSAVKKAFKPISTRYQKLIDVVTPHAHYRWYFTGFMFLVFCGRVMWTKGFFVVSYGLGIYLLNLLIPFISPHIDPEVDASTLPTGGGATEYRPFERRLGEFKFWHGATKAIVISFFLTFFTVFNVPVFWPILLIYFIILFSMTMKKQIAHMIKHKYVPWSKSKAKPGVGEAPAATKGK
eukprot:TRINITY_DN8141_c0_g1_i1.p1 TRINITY_DN8141_c0_g1~~TRINITY_DN8141_c0_g1_i1.p1  ORF type:complete len:196 (-),score=36.94 TRINITY_DN8141_c0_g1_i1:360-947(-)